MFLLIITPHLRRNTSTTELVVFGGVFLWDVLLTPSAEDLRGVTGGTPGGLQGGSSVYEFPSHVQCAFCFDLANINVPGPFTNVTLKLGNLTRSPQNATANDGEYVFNGFDTVRPNTLDEVEENPGDPYTANEEGGVGFFGTSGGSLIPADIADGSDFDINVTSEFASYSPVDPSKRTWSMAILVSEVTSGPESLSASFAQLTFTV